MTVRQPGRHHAERDAVDTIQLGPIILGRVWEPLLHEKVRALTFPPLEGVDCARCCMVKAGKVPARAKCCSYFPDLPSFLVGAVLEEGQAEGTSDRVKAWVAAGRGDPLFVYAPPALKQRHISALDQGPLHALACPLLDPDGRCTIYQNRPYVCSGFNCRYPNQGTFAFWNCLSSLLALHTALVAQYLAEALGVDRTALGAAWSGVAGPQDGWTDEHVLEPELRERLWRGWAGDPETYYRTCYHTILERRDTIREELDRFRRRQLLRTLRDDGRLTAARERAIRDQPTDPAPLAPTEAHALFAEGLVVFGQHRWTIPEHEGFCLWYHDQLFSNPDG
jgi:Fe-S-cluster containining protein